MLAYKKTKTGIFLLLILVASAKSESIKDNNAAEYELLPYRRIPEILNMISSRVQNNYKRIRTWEGKVESEVDYIYEGKNAERIFKTNTHDIGETPRIVMNHADTTIEFSLDAEKDYLYVHSYSDKLFQYMDLDTGRDLGAKGIPGEGRSILTKEYRTQCRADTRHKNVVTSRKAIKQKLQDCSGCQKSPVFDPRESFEAGEPIWETLQHILGQINKDGEWKVGEYSLKVGERKVGDVIQYRIITPAKITEVDILFSTMVFSSEKGFNVILFKVADINDRILQNATWDYELMEGIYLPKKTTQQNYTGKDGGLSYNRESSFKNCKRSISFE